MCLMTEAAMAVYPLFAFTSVQDGGLGISEAEIGVQMGVRAFFHIGTMVFYAPSNRRLGNLKLYQLSMFLWPIVALMFPTLNFILRNGESTRGWLFTSVLSFFFAVWSFAGFTWRAYDFS